MRYTTSAPLPFMGQKRRWVNDLVALLSDATEPTTVVDVFGGSGLLSRLAKDLYPSAHVIYNDHDNYTDRLHHIEDTERLRQEIVQILDPVKCNARVPDHLKERILQTVRAHDVRYSYVDWLTLSTWVLFTGGYARSIDELARKTLYNSPSRTALAGADASARYLQGLDIVSTDWRVLLEEYRDNKNVLYIVDPPYLGTSLDGYAGRVWTCNDYIDLATSIPNESVLYFTSEKFDFIPAFRRVAPSHVLSVSSTIKRISRISGSGIYNHELLYYRL
nr:MAG TPA: DNA adenine methylase [Caudoviricetes sp.]